MPVSNPPATTVDVDGSAIREARKSAGLEIKQLAELVGIDRSYVSLIETGRRTRVSPSVFAAIVKALDVERHELLLDPEQLAS